MKVNLQRVNSAVHFQGSASSSDVHVSIDGSPEIGGEGLGVRPMELVLMALGSCAVLDLLSILKKQRQVVEDVQIQVSGDRTEEVPSVFKTIHIQFSLKGDLDPEKANRAAELAVKKYCSVHDMLNSGGVEIGYSVNLH